MVSFGLALVAFFVGFFMSTTSMHIIEGFDAYREALAVGFSFFVLFLVLCTNLLIIFCGRITTYCRPVVDRDRVKARLAYIADKYADHAPYWQFCVWGRQLLLMASQSFVPSDYELVQAGCALTDLVAWAALHHRIRPYANEGQNRLESALSLENIVLWMLGMIYSTLRNTGGAGFIDAVMVIVFLVPFFALTWYIRTSICKQPFPKVQPARSRTDM